MGHPDERKLPVRLSDVAPLDGVGFAFPRDLLRTAFPELTAQMLQVMHELVNHYATNQHIIVRLKTLIEVHNAGVIVPTERVALAPLTRVLDEKTPWNELYSQR